MILKGSTAREVEGSIIACKSSGPEGTRFHLTLECGTSGQTIADVYMTPEEFALAISGTASKFKGTVYLSPYIGMKMNVKNINIPMTSYEDIKDWDAFCGYAIRYVSDNYPGWSMDTMGQKNHYKLKSIVDRNGKELGRAYEVTIRSWAEIIKLSKKDAEKFVGVLGNPPPPNEALKKAVKKHDKTLKKDRP